jgi:hypothetical protein
MRKRRIVVSFRAGPAWPGGPPEAQPGWDDHARFVDDLVDRGTMVMGGPFSDHSGSLVLFEGVDSNEARRIVDGDPFIQNGVFVLDAIREWTVYVDSLTPAV